MTLYEATTIRIAMDYAVKEANEEKAYLLTSLMKPWKPGIDYIAGQRIRYNMKPYKVLQNHKSQDGWEPDKAPSLFAPILIPDPSIIPEWVQPESTNGYSKGDKVRHNGTIWVSLIDNNVWEPTPSVPTLWAEAEE